MVDSERAASGLPSALQFNPWIHWDPVPWPWLSELFDKRQLIEITKIRLQLHKENLAAQIKATEAIEKVMGSR